MKNKLVNTARISISNFTFELIGEFYKVCFFSTKTNKCSFFYCYDIDRIVNIKSKLAPTYGELQKLKVNCKNGNRNFKSNKKTVY